MLETKKTSTTTVRIDISGTSIIDDVRVVRFNAHLDPQDNPTIVMTVLDTDMYSSEQETVLEDEAQFEEYVCRNGRAATTSMDEETMVFGDDGEKMQK